MDVEAKGGEAPIRPLLGWRRDSFWNENRLLEELERVFDICHGCRRCLTLCSAFATLFELVDDSPSVGLEGVEKRDYWRVVEHCSLCDLCYETRCPYIPPHERQVDFPHLMLRAKAVRNRRRGGGTVGERLLALPDRMGRLASIPMFGGMACAMIDNPFSRRLLRIPAGARLPACRRDTLRRRLSRRVGKPSLPVGRDSQGGVVLFSTCYGNYQYPEIGEHLVAILEHNTVPVVLAEEERCCGMLSLESGDLKGVEEAKRFNVPRLMEWIEKGWSILMLQPSCLQLFRRWLPALFPDDPQVDRVRNAVWDPVEYLLSRREVGRLKTDFQHSLGVVACHLPCHLKIDGSGAKIRDLLNLVPDTYVELVEGCMKRCGVSSCHETGRSPVAEKICQIMPDHYGSSCMLAGARLEAEVANDSRVEHPLALLRMAYGI